MLSEQDKIIQIEKEIDKMLEENKEEFCEPVRAYIIF